MDNELDLDLDNIEADAEKKLAIKNRYQQLSEKVIQGNIEKETLTKAKAEADKKAEELAKERDFFKDFSANVSKYPSASEYQDQILEKVKAGYSTEDAMVSVLNKEGKLVAPPAPEPNRPQAEGGSAPTIIEGEKTLEQMTPAEKLTAFGEADRAGTLVDALRVR